MSLVPGSRVQFDPYEAVIVQDGNVIARLQVTEIVREFSKSGEQTMFVRAEGSGDLHVSPPKLDPTLEESLAEALETKNALEFAEQLVAIKRQKVGPKGKLGPLSKRERREVVYRLMRFLEC